MRIIAGKWRGRPLVAFKASHIRPTTDRVKEVLFNKLQGAVEGARVLDLFAGTGSLSFEALSRGALKVVAVEKSKKSMAILQKNASRLGAASADLSVVPLDVYRYLSGSRDEAFDIVLIDPPFTEKMANGVMEAFSKTALFSPWTSIYIESSKHESLKSQYGELRLADQKSFGDKFLSHFQVTENSLSS